MNDPRPHPFDLVFGDLAPERFPAIRDIVGHHPDFDTFVMAQPAIVLLQELRPDEGLPDGGDTLLALVYAAYCYWAAGQVTHRLGEEQTRALVGDLQLTTTPPASASYIQIAPRLIWGSLEGGEQYEPLDGWFSIPIDGGEQVVALLGVHPARPGLSVMVVAGGSPGNLLPRDDGSPNFAPTMAGGDLAGLHAFVTPQELLQLAWRARDIDGGR